MRQSNAGVQGAHLLAALKAYGGLEEGEGLGGGRCWEGSISQPVSLLRYAAGQVGLAGLQEAVKLQGWLQATSMTLRTCMPLPSKHPDECAHEQMPDSILVLHGHSVLS